MPDLNLSDLFGSKDLDEEVQLLMRKRASDTVIHKVILPFFVGKVTLPKHSQGLHVAEQNGCIMLWYKCYVDIQETTQLPYAIIATGQEMDPSFSALSHVETVLMKDGLVWHVFFGNDS